MSHSSRFTKVTQQLIKLSITGERFVQLRRAGRRGGLSRPYILANLLNPIPQLIDTRVPILQPQPHVLNLLHIQHLRLHPVDPRHLGHLIDAPLQQAQAQRLHDQDLDLLRLDARLLRDGRERHGAVVRRAPEHRFRQRREGDLLPEEGLVLLEERASGEVGFEDAVRGEVAAVEREEEVDEPAVRGVGEGAQDGVEEELAEVVDGVGDEGCDAEVVGAVLAVFEGEGFDVDTGEVEEGVFVVCSEFGFGLETNAHGYLE